MILNLLITLVSVSFAFKSVKGTECGEAYGYVNAFIGSGGAGFSYGGLNPGAQTPYSPLRLGPDTMTTAIDVHFQHFSGYFYPDTTIRAFSHNHLVGGGVNDLGVLGVMPFNVKPKMFDSPVGNFSSRFWWSQFDKSTEIVSPGKYSVFLKDQQVQTDLLAVGNLAAVHKYTYTNSGSTSLKETLSVRSPGVVFDLCHASVMGENVHTESRCLNATITVNPDNLNEFTGSVFFNGGLSGQTMYYIHGEIRTNSKLVGVKDWTACTGFNPKEACVENTLSSTSTSGTLFAMATLGFTSPLSAKEEVQKGDEDLSAEVFIGLSYINTEQAKTNLHTALNGERDFSAMSARTKSQWCDALSLLSFDVNEGDEELKTMLYTAAYRTMMSPSVYTEAGGKYVGMDRAVHDVVQDRIALYGDKRDVAPKAYEFYSDLSLWDTFRTVHPWLLLVNEDIAVGIARSMGEMTAQQNSFPRWTLGQHEGSCMIGEHGAAVILEMILNGFGNELDVATIQKVLQAQSTTNYPLNGRGDVDFYMQHGYVRQDVDDDATALTLSYAFDDYLLAGISLHVNDTDSASAALKRSQNYRKIWSHTRKFFCPKFENGELDCPLDPVGPRAWGEFKEGNAMHWAWYVMHDIPGLISLFSSPSDYDTHLNAFFEDSLPFTKLGGALPNPYYWAGNEHDMMAPFMFSWGPNCTRTQYWSRKTTHDHFSNTPHGLPGNDDYGSMSSFLLFASLGLYPNAGTTTFILGSPRVKNASLKLRHLDGSSSLLSITTNNNSPQNVFVERLLVNGVEHSSPFIDRSVLAAKDGVTLEFFMHSEPTSGLCPSVVKKAV